MFRIIAILCVSLFCTASFAQSCGRSGQPPCGPDAISVLQNAVSSLQSTVTALQAEVQALQAGAGARVFSYSAGTTSVPGGVGAPTAVGTLGPIPAGHYLLMAKGNPYGPQDVIVWFCSLDADLAGNGSFTSVDFVFIDLQKQFGVANNGQIVLMADVVFTNPGKVVLNCGEFFGGPGGEMYSVYLIAQQIL
ncbi:MAG TPA: hypothetical protein VMM27_13005 [Casimicrobiaceae bacterium]|nr:hypothetical protein [Casimicrobiaceae bacterium]